MNNFTNCSGKGNKVESKQGRFTCVLRACTMVAAMLLMVAGISLDAAAQSVTTVQPVVTASTTADTYEFYNQGTLVRTQKVVAGDYLYEPQSPAVSTTGSIFTGWYPQGSSEALNFTNGILVVPSVSGATVRVDAQYTVFHYATFRDQDNHIYSRLSVKDGQQLAAPANLTPKLSTQIFLGWSTQPDQTTQSAVVSFPVTLTQDVTYYPVIQTGHYIHFDANRSYAPGMSNVNVSYTPPIFVQQGQTASAPTTNPVADIAAYTFAGWYTDPECTQAFNWSTVITEDITLYARWNTQPVQYKVIIWRQKVDDDKNATGDDRNWDYYTSYTGTAAIGSTINYDNTLRYSGSTVTYGTNSGNRINQITYTGFTQDHYDATITVAADGSSVLNVYYRRNLMTINFNDYYYDLLYSITGLYGATFSQSVSQGDDPDHYVWPAQYSWSDGNMTQTLLTAFTMTENPYNLRQTGNSGTAYIYHVRQKADGTWPTSTTDETNVSVARGSGSNFNVSNKFTDFMAAGYQRNANTLNAPGTPTSAGNSINMSTNQYPLAIYHTRNQYPLEFYDGNTLKQSHQVYYEGSLVDYANYKLTPLDPGRYSFGGWAVAPDKHSEADAVDLTTMTMPSPSMRLYAIWVSIAYNVQLDLGADDAEMDAQQSRNFWPSYGSTINDAYMTTATRPGYSLVGWFDADGNAWDFANAVSKDLCDEGPLYDEEYQNYYYVLHLTAKWRLNSNIEIEYDVNGGSGDFVDEEKYVQYGDVQVLNGQPVPPTDGNVTRYFTGWVDALGNLHQPGTTFTLDDEGLYYSKPETPNVVYVKLAAQYTTSVPTATITYHANGGTPADNVLQPETGSYEWRETTTLKDAIYEKEDNCLIGWSLNENTTEADFDLQESVMVAAMNVKIDTTTNIGNADLYAVWSEKPTATLENKAVCAGGTVTMTPTSVGEGVTHYKWDNDENWTNYTDMASMAKTYENVTENTTVKLTVKDANGCVNYAEVTVTVISTPAVTLTGADACFGNAATITPALAEGSSTPTHYKWSTDQSWSAWPTTGAPAAKTFTETGDYSAAMSVKIQIDEEQACEATSEEVTVKVNPMEEVTVKGSDFCEGSSTKLSVAETETTITSYKWSDNSTGETLTVSEAGPYSVTVTFEGGCTATGSKTVAMNQNPEVVLSGDDNVCYGADATYTATVTPVTGEAYNYAWNNGTASSTNTFSVENITTAGNVTVLVTETAKGTNCSTTKTLDYTVYGQLVPGAIQYQTQVCHENDTIRTITNTTPASGGDNGHYVWQYSNDNGQTWSDVLDANNQVVTSAQYTIPASYHTTYRRAWVTETCGTVYTNEVYVIFAGNVDPGTISGETYYCYGTEVTKTLLPGTVSIESSAPYTLQWQSSTDGGTTWTNYTQNPIPSTNTSFNIDYSESSFTQEIEFRYLITIEGCDPIPCNGTIKLKVNELPVVQTITTPTETALCPNLGSYEVSASVTGGSGTYTTYTWGGDATQVNAASTTVTEMTGTDKCNKEYTVTLKVKDDKGCWSEEKTESFTVVDVTAPEKKNTASWPTLEAQDACFAAADTTGLLNASEVAAMYEDACGAVTVTVSDASIEGADNCSWTWTRTYTIMDACGNTVDPKPTMSVTGGDNTAPVINTESDSWVETMQAERGSDCSYVVPDLTSMVKSNATDNCTDASALTVTQTPEAGTTVSENTTVTVTVADACTNSSEESVSITIPESVITVTTPTKSWPYDGQSHSEAIFTLTNGNVTETDAQSGTEVTLPNGDKATVTVSGSVTNVSDGEVTNAAEVVVKDAEGTDVTCYYTITENEGKLTITKREVTLASASDTKEYDGNPLTNDEITVGGDGFAEGEGATYNVTGTQTLVGSSTNTFSYTLNEGTSEDNYTITKTEGTLTVTDRTEKYPIEVVSNSETVTYDGEEHTAEGFETLTFTTVDGNDYTVEGLTATVTKTDAGTYDNTITGTPVVKDEDGNDVTAQFDVTLVNGKLVINPANLVIELDSTKIYDGTKFVVSYEQLHVTGLVSRDHITGGTVTSEDYVVGVYRCEEGGFQLMNVEGVAVKEGFAIDNGLGNYVPKFNVTLRIVEREITVTAHSASKSFDGEALTEEGYDTENVAEGDAVAVTITGEQICMGTSANVPSDAVITRTADNDRDVTDSYIVNYVNGTLSVTEAEAGAFTCPEAETKTMKDCELTMTVTVEGEPTVEGIADGSYTVENNLAELNPMSEGVHEITWTMKDNCGNVVASCTQTVTLQYGECTGTAGYEAVRIGSQCWMKENLKDEVGTFKAYKEDNANLEKFGYLYTWYTAMGLDEGDDSTDPWTDAPTDACGNPYVQGICPDGWAVGSDADYALLGATAGDASFLKDPSTEYWLPEKAGVAEGNLGFNARGGGWYNSTLGDFEDIYAAFRYWTPDMEPGSAYATSGSINYFCNVPQTVLVKKSDMMSVRCIRKVQE